MKKIFIYLVFVSILSLFIFNALSATNGDKGPPSVALSKETEACIECHRLYSPGIVADWQKSRHSTTAPRDALSKPALQRRISAETVPQSLAGVAVGCYECHALNGAAHKDNFDHFDLKINVV
ncbi:MAG: hypothetical protein H6Q53_422, partial [Deltaproteobacteria bacterium]|nr:hypothetical protein [Deltaproteobacteria bacterium]